MVKAPNHWLRTRDWYTAQRAGKALAKWLNEPKSGNTFNRVESRAAVQELLNDAQLVFNALTKYKTAAQFHVARRSKKLPPHFWKTYDRLNGTLQTFATAPRIELSLVYQGDIVSWISTNDSSTAPVTRQVTWLLQVIGQGVILNVRTCQQCENWFFARVSHQKFCKPSCQMKDFSETDSFKEERRKYMREYRRR